MKQNQVRTGDVLEIRIGSHLAAVEVTRLLERWSGTQVRTRFEVRNPRTNRTFVVKSAQRFRRHLSSTCLDCGERIFAQQNPVLFPHRLCLDCKTERKRQSMQPTEAQVATAQRVEAAFRKVEKRLDIVVDDPGTQGPHFGIENRWFFHRIIRPEFTRSGWNGVLHGGKALAFAVDIDKDGTILEMGPVEIDPTTFTKVKEQVR